MSETYDAVDNKKMSAKHRERLLREHPIVKRNYTLLTKAIAATYSVLRERVWTRRTGTVLVAQPRVGKTTCAEAVRRLLNEEFTNIYVMYLSGGDGSETKRSGIVEDMHMAVGLALEKRPNPKLQLERILIHILTCVSARGGDQFVLVVDEMQYLFVHDLMKLAQIHNHLHDRGVTMTTLGFAQPSISNLQAALVETNAFNLIARFLAEPILFEGCIDIAGLETILEAYDQRKFFPEDSDWSYTRFFLPKAFRNGFRLKNCAKLIWNPMVEAMNGFGNSSVPMEYLTRVVESLLQDCRSLDNPEFELLPELIESAIRKSNIELFSAVMREANCPMHFIPG